MTMTKWKQQVKMAESLELEKKLFDTHINEALKDNVRWVLEIFIFLEKYFRNFGIKIFGKRFEYIIILEY